MRDKLIFRLNAFLPVPAETVVAIVGLITFAAGLLFSVFALLRALVSLWSAETRSKTGLAVPVLTILIAAGALAAVVITAIQVERTMDQGAKSENKHPTSRSFPSETLPGHPWELLSCG